MKPSSTPSIRVTIFFSGRAAASQSEPQASGTLNGLIELLATVTNQFAEEGHLVQVVRFESDNWIDLARGLASDLSVVIGRTSAMEISNVATLGRPILDVFAETPKQPCEMPAYGSCLASEAYTKAQELRQRFAQTLLEFASRLPGIVISRAPEPPVVRQTPPAPPAPTSPLAT